MSVCKDLEPRAVFSFFEEIAGIPHGSGNTKAISDYCVDFAKKRGLFVRQDDQNNVIIKKPGTPGYEESEPVILQGHLDMVCEKAEGCTLDFAKDGLRLYVEGDFLKALGTTLGGDDGIAVAYALALLDADDICHPPLEVVFTVDEEVGMLGAESVDLTEIQGRRLLNIDSDQEGYFLTSCAGGLRADCRLPVSREKVFGRCCQLKLHGLFGGHSGSEIHKERANAVMTAGRVLKALREEVAFSLVDLGGGLMDNAIPRECSARLVVPGDPSALTPLVDQWQDILKKEYSSSDPDITVSLTMEEEGDFSALDARSLSKALFLLRNVPYGIQHMSREIPGLVETSLNPGIMKLHEEQLQLSFSLRSSVTSRKYEMLDRLEFLTEFLGGEVETSGDYPAWEYRADSPLRRLMTDTYRELFQREPIIEAIHAGLECGIFSGKLPGLDCISFGPDNYDIHTPQERLSISSTQRVWKLIVEFLKRAK